MSYEDWTPQELANKADWEGGIAELIGYGGPSIFTCLGPEAVEIARQVQAGLAALSALLPDPQ